MQSIITADYHTHTVYSHGTGSVEENVLSAIEKGLCEIGISDHGFRQIAHGISKKGYLKQANEIRRLNEKYKNIRILTSVEANIVGTDGSIDMKQEWVSKLDYLIAGFHRTAVPWRVKDLIDLQFTALISPRKARRNMTDADVAAINTNGLMLITHPGEYIAVDIKRVAEAAASRNVLIEINNKHPMSKQNLLIAKETGCRFILSSEAHRPEDVGKVDRAYDAALSAGIECDRIINLRKDPRI